MYAAYGARTQAGINRIDRERRLLTSAMASRESTIALIAKEEAAGMSERSAVILRLPLRHTYAMIERRILKVFKITRNQIQSARRDRRLVLARQAIMYWCCRLTALSLPQIGRFMGGKDHTTVMHGRNLYPQKRAAMGRNLRQVR